jgi:hypothetical protein
MPADWRFWFRCAGGSAYLHARENSGPEAALAYELLQGWAADPELGIAAVHHGQDLERLRAGSGAVCAIDAEPGIQFIEDWDGPTVETAPYAGAFGADHGYPPQTAGYRSLFMAAGPGIRQGANPGSFGMVDVAPTLAHMLGLEFPACDGSVNEVIFK